MNAPDDSDNYQPPISEDLAAQPVSKYMTKKVVTTNPSTTVKNAISVLLAQQVSALPVVDAKGICIGVFSEFDAIIQGASTSLDEPIKYSKNPMTVFDDTRFRDALIMLLSKRIKRLPVVDITGKLLGVISRADFLKAIFNSQK